MPDDFDPYYTWLAIPPDEQPPTLYRLLGVRTFEDNPEVIENVADQRMAFLRTLQSGKRSDLSEKLLNEISAARLCLLNEQKKADYDAKLREYMRQKAAGEEEDEELSDTLVGFLELVNTEEEKPADEKKSVVPPPVAPKPVDADADDRKRKIIIGAGIAGGVFLLLILATWAFLSSDGSDEHARSVTETPGDAREVATPPPPPPPLPPPSPPPGLPGGRPDNDDRPAPPPIGDLPPGQWVDALKYVDPKRDRVWGDWTRDGDAITVAPRLAARLMLPFDVGENYDLEVEFTRNSGENSVVVVLPLGTRQSSLQLSSWKERVCGLSKGSWSRYPPSGTPFPLTNGRRYTVLTSVRARGNDASIQVSIDGNPLIAWSGETASLGIWSGWKMPEPGRAGLGAYDTSVTFHRVRIRLPSDTSLPVEPSPVEPPPEGPVVELPPREPVPPTPPAPKQPVPSAAAQQEAARQLNELYDESKADTPSARLQMAKELFALAGESRGNPAEKFVILHKAAKLASDGRDAVFMLEIIDAMAAQFEMDSLRAKGTMLKTFAEKATDSVQIRSLVAAARRYAGEAAAAGQYEFARSIAAVTFQTCQRSAGKAFRREAFELRQEVQKICDDYQKFQQATAAVRDDPSDAGANLTVGRFCCFVRGDWQNGLQHLAKGSDAGLADLAKQELASPSGPAEKLALGDRWWDAAERRPEKKEKEAMVRRAAHWYRQAGPGLGGLDKARVARRLAEIADLLPDDPTGPRNGPPKKEIAVDLGGGVNMELVLIRPGSFVMGSDDESESEKPPHRVNITRPFYLGKYEVTQEQWQAVMGNNPSRFPGAQKPVENVTWDDCQVFLAKMNAKSPPGVKFSLPTEAQWEYACRAGAATTWHFGDDEGRFPEYGWCRINSGGETHPVGRKRPNPWGLHDMHGNVVEYCADWYDEDYYKRSPAGNPPGPPSGTRRSIRGGGWFGIPTVCRSATRRYAIPDRGDSRYGFRVAGTLP